MKKYIIYFFGGSTEIVEGNTFDDAFKKAGYNSRVLTIVDFWEEGEEINYAYSKKERMWIKIIKLNKTRKNIGW